MLEIPIYTVLILTPFSILGSVLAQVIMWRFLANNPDHRFGFYEGLTRVFWFGIGQAALLISLGLWQLLS